MRLEILSNVLVTSISKRKAMGVVIAFCVRKDIHLCVQKENDGKHKSRNIVRRTAMVEFSTKSEWEAIMHGEQRNT